MEAIDEQVGVAAADLDRIIHELDENQGKLPKQAIQEARTCREQIVPRLINALEDATAAARAGNVPEGNAHFFALFLLAEFRATAALPAIVAAISLPDELSLDLFGDAIHGTLPRALAVLAADNLDVVDGLIRDRSLNEFVRWAAAETYVYLVAGGRMPRAAAIAALRQHLKTALDLADDQLAGPLASALIDLGAAEAHDDIAEAFRLNLVDDSMFDLDFAERAFAAGESWVQNELQRHSPAEIVDTIDELQSWAAFAEEAPPQRPWWAQAVLNAGLLDDPREHSLDADQLLPRVLDEPPQPEHEPDVPDPAAVDVAQPVEPRQRIGRNEPCPCGSGKKFKRCCGRH